MRVIMLEAALPRIAHDGIDETSPENPVELFRKVRDKWLIDGEGIQLLAKSLINEEHHSVMFIVS